MRKLSIFFMILTVLAASLFCITASAAGSFSSASVIMREQNAPDGSIYFGGGAPSYRLEMQNTDYTAYDIDMTYTVSDNSGNTVMTSQPESFTLNARSNATKSIKVQGEYENAIYKVTVSLKGSFGTIEKEDKFSIVSKNNELSDFIGLSTHFGKTNREQIDESDEILTGGGFGWVRDEIYWDEVETGSGFSVPQFAEEYVDFLTQNGTKILLTLGLTHPSYDGGNFPSSDAAVEAYAEYCGFIAEYFKGKIDTFEIFNEPDLYYNQDGSNVTGEQYAKLLKAAYTSIKQAQPDATVIAGALTEMIGSEPFLKSMLNVPDIGDYMDALSIHPYSNTGYYVDECKERVNKNILQNIQIAEKNLDAAGLNDLPIWLTEFGSTSNNEDGHDNSYGYTEEEQAVNLVRASVLARTDARVKRTFIYNFKEKGASETEREDNFGIVEYSGMKAKPAFLALSHMNKMLGTAEFKSYNADPSIDTRTLSTAGFESNNGDEVFVLWANARNNATAELKIVCDKEDNEQAEIIDGVIHSYVSGAVRIYDIYGNEINATGGTVKIGAEPVYVVCGKRSIDIKENNNKLTVSGRCAHAGENVTILVRKENEIGHEIAFVDQTRSDESGEFSFVFDIDDDDIYNIYVYNGAVKLGDYFGKGNYEFEIDYTVNGQELTDISQIKTGDTVKMTVRAKTPNAMYENLTAIAAAYKTNGVLMSVGMTHPLWDDIGAVFTASVTIQDKEDLNILKFMLWNEDMQPEFDAAVLEKGEDKK